ncbi:MAG: glycosyltransferase family 4 protein [Verrucomicrobiota bacterium]
MSERIGFVSTRFAGLDGVSLESAKWAEVFWNLEHESFWYGGKLDRAPDRSHCIPEAFFGHSENQWINQRLWGQKGRSRLVSRRIRDMAEYLKGTLYDYVDFFDLSILVIENAISIPMQVPLGVAIAEFMAETRFPVIAHHHDFYWERTRFSINAAQDYIELAFPPRDPHLQHVVINEEAREQLSWRKGVSSTLVPNVLDFENPPPPIDDYAADVREQIGLAEDDIFILQPTRVVPRKGIEHAIKLVEMLDNPRCKLVISHESGDEGWEYQSMLEELAWEANVNLLFIDRQVGDVRQENSEGKKMYTLWDLYPHADLVTYPSLYEGFGNAFLEALWFKVPILVNRYSIFARDIEPKGFRLPILDGFMTRSVAEEVQKLLDDAAYREEVMNHNYEVARRFFGYDLLRGRLDALITHLKGL